MSHPRYSIIMPAYNGQETIDRAIHSVLHQSEADWELLTIDDCSTDDTYEELLHWGRIDQRIRVFRTDANAGPSRTRNVGLEQARGEAISYLDCDDEYYPDFLSNVRRFIVKADVLMFGYDRDSSSMGLGMTPWFPLTYLYHFFEINISTPLGVAHRRELLTRVGGFNENVWVTEDWDYWRRLARSGAEFLYLPLKSGIYHVRGDSLSHSPQTLERQRILLDENMRASTAHRGIALPDDALRHTERIAFASRDSLIDVSSLETDARAYTFDLVSRAGFECQAFCSVHSAQPSSGNEQRCLTELGLPFQIRDAICESHSGRLILTRRGRVPITLLEVRPQRPEDFGVEFIPTHGAFLSKFLDVYRADAVVVDSTDPLAHSIALLAKRRDTPVILWLDQIVPDPASVFWHVDYCLVPTEFTRAYYWDYMGLACHTLPTALDWDRLRAERRVPRCLTCFLGSGQSDAIPTFARLARYIAHHRPDIPLLLVGRPDPSALQANPGLDPDLSSFLMGLENMTDFRSAYAVTKLLVVPSPVPRASSVAAVGALINGIPIIANDNGAMSEILGKAGRLIEQDAVGGQPISLFQSLGADNLEAWVGAVLELWDNPDLYRQLSVEATHEAQRWHPDRLVPLYREFFRTLRPQSGGPYVPKIPT